MGDSPEDKRALRELPRLTEEQRKRAQGNAAFERAWKDMADSVRSNPNAAPADASVLSKFQEVLGEIQIGAREKLMAKNQEDPRAVEVMSAYVAPYSYSKHAPKPAEATAQESEVAAPSVSNVAPEAVDIVRGAKKASSFKFEPVEDEFPRCLFIFTERLGDLVKVELVWQQVSRGNKMSAERAYAFDLQNPESSKAGFKDLTSRFKDSRMIAFRSKPVFDDLNAVYATLHDDDQLWRIFGSCQNLDELVGALDPEIKPYGKALTIDDLCKSTKINRRFVESIYNKAPRAATLHAIYKSVSDALLARADAAIA